MDSTEILAIAAIVVSVAGMIPLYLDYFGRRGVTFILQKFQEPTHQPIDSLWGIRILYPSRAIEDCGIFWNDVPLPWWDSGIGHPAYRRLIVIGGAGNVRVPKELESGDGEIIVKDGKKRLRTKKFSEINASPS
jgi:hypothetical protein